MKHINEYSEFKKSLITEKLARGLKPLLKIGSTITKKVGEDALLDLSDKFDSIDDEYAGTIASHLDMAIELMQDGYAGDATKKLKQFNKACKDVLNGKNVGSAFESVNDASNNLEKIFGTDQETMDMFQRIEDKGTVKDMIEFIDEFGNEEMLSRYGIRSTAQVKKLAKTIMNEATDVNDPVLIAFRATRRDLPKLKLPKVKSRRLSFDKYMDLLDARMDVDQQIKDL